MSSFPTVRVVGLLAVLLAGCHAAPKEIHGRRVIDVRWVDGKRIYILAPNASDAELMQKGAREAADAAKGVIFAPPDR